MRPVNLLPERDRVQAPVAADGSSYVILGVLGALLLAVFAFVVTSNQVNSRTSDIATAEAEAEQAEQRAAAFGPFQEFAQIKAARLASVKTLADTRFDWERLMRELALVLPEGTSLTSLTASSVDAAATATAPPPPPEGAGVTTATAPGAESTLTLSGCATSQPKVAVMLVRLRQLYRATDVTLVDSGQQDSAGDGGASSDSGAPSAPSDGCAPSDYLFNASVTFGPAPPGEETDGDLNVPTTLGGGA